MSTLIMMMMLYCAFTGLLVSVTIGMTKVNEANNGDTRVNLKLELGIFYESRILKKNQSVLLLWYLGVINIFLELIEN